MEEEEKKRKIGYDEAVDGKFFLRRDYDYLLKNEDLQRFISNHFLRVL